MSQKVLVTGSAGFIGHHLVERILTDTDWRVVCLDRLDSAGNLARLANSRAFQQHRDRVEVVFHDLRAAVSKGVGTALVTGNYRWGHEPFAHVLHLAAGSHVDRSVLDPSGFVLDNVLGTAHLLDFCRDHAEQTLYFSTDEVFGPADSGEEFAVNARLNPNNPYAASKAGGELLCPAYANTYGMKLRVTRCANAFGPGQDREKFIPLCIRNVLAGRKVLIHARTTYGRQHGYRPGYVEGLGDPPYARGLESSARLYTHHRNVTGAVLKVVQSGDLLSGDDTAGRYNISGGEEQSNLHVAQEIARLLDRELRYELVVDPPGRPRPDMRYGIDASRLLELGWVPEVSFDAGLAETVEVEGAKAEAAE